MKIECPYCRNNQLRSYRCVVNKDNCVDGVEEFLNIYHISWHEPCHCHHVNTEMCFLTLICYPIGAPSITADSSFCAVRPCNCLEGYS